MFIAQKTDGKDDDYKVCANECPTIRSTIHKRGDTSPIVVDMRHPRNSDNPVRVYDECYALQSNQYKEPPVVNVPDAAMCLDQDGYLRLTGARPRDENGKPQLLPIGYRRFRRLTPLECERLQGWPDDCTMIGLYRASDLPKSKRNGSEYELDIVSDTQRYRMTGNGVTADVVREVVKKMMLVGCFVPEPIRL